MPDFSHTTSTTYPILRMSAVDVRPIRRGSRARGVFKSQGVTFPHELFPPTAQLLDELSWRLDDGSINLSYHTADKRSPTRAKSMVIHNPALARHGWTMPSIDSSLVIRSCYAGSAVLDLRRSTRTPFQGLKRMVIAGLCDLSMSMPLRAATI